MKIYLSGPMTGYPDLNFPLFHHTEGQWNRAGWEAISPTRNGLPDGLPWEAYMRADIFLLIDCDAMAMLPLWEHSRGAVLEHHIGLSLGMRIYDARHMVEPPRE